MKTLGTILLVVLSSIAIADDDVLDDQGGHFDPDGSNYHCHAEPCFTIQREAEEAFIEADPQSFTRIYRRTDWPHWMDADRDCQDTRQEVLIASSSEAIAFKSEDKCKVKSGRWHDVYTGRVFTDPSDIDIDHLVPLAHAHRNGGAEWTITQKMAFANDIANLVAVDDSTNQSKSDKAPHEWLPPRVGYWCEYGRRWEYIKDKYGLSYSDKEVVALNVLARSCR